VVDSKATESSAKGQRNAVVNRINELGGGEVGQKEWKKESG
jgi:hypothetical protein